MPAHWKGVNGLGMKLLTLTLSCSRAARVAQHLAAQLAHLQAEVGDGQRRLRRSSSGKPDHEVQLERGPAAAEGLLGGGRGCRPRSTFLLMMSRIRWLPASGARVSEGPVGDAS